MSNNELISAVLEFHQKMLERLAKHDESLKKHSDDRNLIKTERAELTTVLSQFERIFKMKNGDGSSDSHIPPTNDLYQEKSWKKIALYTELIELYPTVPMNYFQRGWALGALGFSEQAVMDLEKGLSFVRCENLMPSINKD